MLIQSLGQSLDELVDFVADPAIVAQDDLRGAGGLGHFGRVIETHMYYTRRIGKRRALIIGVAADRDHHIEGYVSKILQMFGALAGDIYPGLGHHPHRERIQDFRFHPR